MKKETFLRLGLINALVFSTGCSNNDKLRVNTKDEVEIVKTIDNNSNKEVSSTKKEAKSNIEKKYDKDNKTIRYYIGNKFKPEILNWQTVQRIFNLNEKDYKKDVFRDEASYEEVNIREKNYIEHSFDVLKNNNVGIFVGQEHGLDKWSIKIGMNEINEDIISEYFTPVIKEIFNDDTLAKEISKEALNTLKELDDNYVLGSIESTGNHFSIVINKNNINMADITMFDSPNIYAYNIELVY